VTFDADSKLRPTVSSLLKGEEIINPSFCSCASRTH
jgi:hypothetical protein